ncbi:hypothetical protein B0H15DRAFT_957218 [Mycena belliarum]|uniref:Uncharacterized protein n=1 Tax=Mycena belliarum TaxID=1033014 RepID=A0AAD6TRD2_9AGAR|nr:hypothetical protein B0H15DRAFT_957218 [Mycena belliae]
MYPTRNDQHASEQDTTYFSNPCGRGCGHIFEYAGPNPLENISRLVNEHWSVCPGRNPSATHALNTHWEPEPRIVDEVNRGRDERVHEERALSHSGRSWSPPPGDADDVPASGPSGSGTSSPSARSTRSLSSLSTHTPTSLAAEHTGKKSSRSEGERRRTLEDDEWTMRVTPHEVVCRGCRRSIKLDRRSRYYPGLWEKHRDRCEHVAKMRRLLEDEAGPSHHAQQPPPFEAGPAYSAPAALRRTQSWTFDPAALAPRKSYYRGT